jgi:predicted hotdog family 3-hydroxylacyl-ACP dehydratase
VDLVYLEGHFPGHPLLPGFVQVHWVMALAREHLGVGASPGAIEALKFRAPLRPGQEFGLAIDASPDRLRFELGAGSEALSSGRVVLDERLPQHESAPEVPPAPPDAGLPLRLLQAGAMRVLERVLAHDARATVCEARIAETTPLCERGAAPAWLAIELLAQAMAAHGGLVASTGAPRRGFLVSARRIELRTRAFRVGERLWVRAEHQRGELGMVAFACALGSGAPPRSAEDARARALASGSLAAFVEPADAPVG